MTYLFYNLEKVGDESCCYWRMLLPTEVENDEKYDVRKFIIKLKKFTSKLLDNLIGSGNIAVPNFRDSNSILIIVRKEFGK